MHLVSHDFCLTGVEDGFLMELKLKGLFIQEYGEMTFWRDCWLICSKHEGVSKEMNNDAKFE